MMTDINSKGLPRIETESVAVKAQTAIRNYVLSGQVKPGSRLVASQLAIQLGVSRAPVREALLRLEAEGLVESVPNKGTFVVEIAEDNLREIYTVRSLLEGLAMRLAVQKMDKDMLRELANIVERMKQAARDGDVERVAALDFDFHQRIWQLSGHKKLYQLLTSMMAQIRMFLALNVRVYDDLLDNCLEHVELFDALVSGDAAKAERLMIKHIDEAGEVTIDYLRRTRPVP